MCSVGRPEPARSSPAEERLIFQHRVDPPGVACCHREIAKISIRPVPTSLTLRLKSGSGAPPGKGPRIIIDPYPKLIGPAPRPGGLQIETVDPHRCETAGIRIEAPHDDGLRASVEEKVAHREPERALQPEATERTLEIAETIDIVARSSGRAKRVRQTR